MLFATQIHSNSGWRGQNSGNFVAKMLLANILTEWYKMWSRLTAQVCHFFWPITRNQDFFDKKCRILMFGDEKCRNLVFCDKKNVIFGRV
jgi:hypothetical protein